VSAGKRPAQGDWYSPYFAPTTVFVAISVLFLSIEAGKYTGAYLIQRDRAAQAPLTAPIQVERVTTKAAGNHMLTRSHAGSSGKSHH
jgi:hypothetical protein